MIGALLGVEFMGRDEGGGCCVRRVYGGWRMERMYIVL